jgi:2'-hydroxyisoflavone reductase
MVVMQIIQPGGRLSGNPSVAGIAQLIGCTSMRTLILGGTVFLGRHVAAEALARGHELTLFTRGVHRAIDGAEHLRGDRTGDLSALEGREWDVVIDTSGYEAAHVARSCAALAGSGAHLVFVSSCNVYPRWPAEPVDEDSPVWESGDDYGAQKAASERAAEAALPGRVASVRAGLICGPHDNVFRLPWWVRRIAAGGRVPAPGDPDRTVQLVDARDLAAWMLDLGERRVAGAFNGTAPAGRTTMGEVLEAAVAATGSGAELAWVPDERLQDAGVEPWTELPLWLPEAEFPGTWGVGAERAQASGLRCRPSAETVADVWAWLRGGGESELDEWRSEHRPRPMTPEREHELIG